MIYKILYIILILFTYSFGKPINISKMHDGIDIIQYTEYYKDTNSKITFDKIKKLDIAYKKAEKTTLSFGYDYTDTIWLKFTLLNNSNKPIKRILEFDNIYIGEFTLYDLKTNKHITSGYNHQKVGKHTTTYPVNIELKAFESKDYIIKASSNETPLNIKLRIWDLQTYQLHQIRYQIILALFFGSVMALLLYNLSLFFFVRDRVYLYYCAYLASMIVHTLYFTGFLNLYVIPGFYLKHRYIADLMIYFLLIFISPFVRNYLHLEKIAPKTDKILLYLPAVISIVAALKIAGLISAQLSILIYLLYAPLLFFVGFYAVYLGVKEAYYFLAGWTFMIIGMLLMALYTTGLLPVFVKFPYLLEFGYFFETILFSIGLAARINTLKKQKEEADAKLIFQQKLEHKKLETKVRERTKKLKHALNEKEMLFKELNHRVKNNLQMVVSLLRLQNDNIKEKELKEILISAQNRINAMSNLHKLLYQQKNFAVIDTKQYFKQIASEIKNNIPYEHDIQINLDINTNLTTGQAIYCGLIVNELLSNAIKHGLKKNRGKVSISLDKNDQDIILKISDNGIGFSHHKKKDSLGLVLVETLVTQQLKGEYSISSNMGTHVVINFKNLGHV